MLNGWLAALCVLLFLLLFSSLKFGLDAIVDHHSLMKRLAAKSNLTWSPSVTWKSSHSGRIYGHVADLLSAVRWTMGPASFFLWSLFLILLGFAGGIVLFQTVRPAGLLSLMLGSLPYVVLRMSLINRQMATRLEFLPAVELFYQSYLITGCRHIRSALQKTIEERRLPGEVQAVFDQLCRHLSVRGNDEESLRRFALAFGHVWADYFRSILAVALSEGNNVADNLKELISDMRKAQLANRQERHRLLEIRLANFTPVLFLALFLGINFRMNPEGSYRYYVLDPAGRGMLLNALALLFGSLLMGLYLSRKKM